MTEEEQKQKRSRSSGNSTERRGSRSRQRGRGPSGAQLAARAKEELAEITGLEPESVTSLERSEDGGWIVTVELLELSRIPNTDDILGSYEAELDEDGELLGYRRLRRYSRSQADQAQQLQGG